MKLDRYWYSEHRDIRYYLLLVPMSWLFCFLVSLRQMMRKAHLLRSQKLPVPIIVIGNITAGGTGKTPLVIWLARFLKENGYNPGIISRGYRGKAKSWPQQVRADSDYIAVGDEAVMIAARTECPMAVGPDRPAVVRSLLEHHDIDVIISDDGLQHYALARDIEVAVIDGTRRFGNGHCLPAGPLREKPQRLDTVDLIVVNGEGERREHPMTIYNGIAVNLVNGETRPLPQFTDTTVHAVAGVGNPERFFDSLHGHGLIIEAHPFADHHDFSKDDICFDDNRPVLMTEKDAVKCVRFATESHWCVPASVEIGQAFSQRLLRLLNKVKSQ
ncbi:MAG: tetraacyldisaccharide 4'-kinase [Gammaproteobacteria bacterium]|nr:MAG: tetraacyldisaccharide 4'-kinase [Gammaproteobacteria bacterium]